MSELAHRVRALREERNLTRDDLAERAELTTRAVAFIEDGETAKPQRKTLERLARALGVSVLQLLNNKTKGEPSTSRPPQTPKIGA